MLWMLSWDNRPRHRRRVQIAPSVVIAEIAGMLPEAAAPNPLALFLTIMLGLRL